MSIPLHVIVARSSTDGAIGKEGSFPWKIGHDMNFFKRITTNIDRTAVIMGRRTFESMGSKCLPNRINIIISTTLTIGPQNCHFFPSLQKALDYCNSKANRISQVFVIGGTRLYHETYLHPQCTSIYITHVLKSYADCDTFVNLPDRKTWAPVSDSDIFSEKGTSYTFSMWTRKSEPIQENIISTFLNIIDETRYDENEYLNLIYYVIMKKLNVRSDRTLVGTHSSFGHQCRYDLTKGFPLFTTKRTFWKGIVHELLWMISGSTNSKILEQNNVNIWKGNGSREFLDNNGFRDRKEGDLGPIYGFQWRHLGAKYISSNHNYFGQGIDQLANVIDMIKNNPTSRRIIMNAWNVSDLSNMALPPCHILCQFYVDADNHSLSCHMYQRSADLGLGVPFNVASYSLLLHMIAHVCKLRVGEFIHSMGDAHVYSNHVDALKIQLSRSVRKAPQLEIIDPENRLNNIDLFRAEHFKIVNYKPHKTIKMTMAV